jgi:hypothetical protein
VARTIDDEDMIFHALFIGSTGAGKTNALLYWLHSLFANRKDVALVLIDPHGDAAIDLVRLIPKSERERITILDPSYVSFGLNPLSLPAGAEGANRVQVLQTQVEELSALLSDVFNTDAATAPRLMWVFKGALYYLYTLDDNPTFRDLYRILVDFISMHRSDIETMLRRKQLEDEIIRSTIDAISKLPKDAFAPVVNRISNFVLPPQSITSRTFCSRTSKLDFDEMMVPGRLTIFRITKTLPYDFRRLIAASIMMRFYFAVEKRAAKLERAGEPPSARTPIILAIDEFQNISDLKLLDTILSESRKSGLYLWMVNQNIQQIRPDLFSSLSGNVGPVYSFRVGPEDASKMSELISPTRKEEVRDALISLPDYSCVVRKRPHGEDVVGKPILFESFPRVGECLCDTKEVVDYMRKEMEEKFGGAYEDTTLIYKSPAEEILGKSGSRALFNPVAWRVLTAGYLKLFSDAYPLEFSRLRTELFAKHSWRTSDVNEALNSLVDAGFLTQTFARQEYVMKGKDVNGNPVMVPPDPSVADQMDRTKTIIYNLTPLALEYLQMRVGTSKAGDPKHLRVIEKLLKQEYWPKGYFTVVDWGEGRGGKPDIAVMKPRTREIKDKDGNELRMPDPYYWDYSTVVAVEVEMAPQKNRDQVTKNYRKNTDFYSSIRFVVTSDINVKQLQEILTEVKADPEKYRIDKIEFETLNDVEPARSEEHEVKVEVLQPLGRAEMVVLSLVIAGGYTSREEIAKKCGEAGLDVGERSVSRYLRNLTERGLLKRVGNGYEATEQSRKLAGQDIL